jgi:hypothetical protein
MTGKTTVTLERLGNELYHIVLNASAENKARILHSCSNAALKMESDAKKVYYAGSGMHMPPPTGLMVGGYRGFMDAHGVGNDTFIRVGVRNDEAQSRVGKRVNYAVIHEWGCGPYVIKPLTKQALFWPGAAHPVGQVNHPGLKARLIATKSVIHQGEALVKNLLREVGF